VRKLEVFDGKTIIAHIRVHGQDSETTFGRFETMQEDGGQEEEEEIEIFKGIDEMRKIMEKTQEWWNHLLNIKHGQPYDLPQDSHIVNNDKHPDKPGATIHDDLEVEPERLHRAERHLDALVTAAVTELKRTQQMPGTRNVRFILCMFIDECRLRREKVQRTIAARQLKDAKAKSKEIVAYSVKDFSSNANESIRKIIAVTKDLQQMLDAVKTIQPVDVPSQELKATLVECLECKLQLHDNQVELLKATEGKLSDPMLPALRIIKDRWDSLKHFSLYALYLECEQRQLDFGNSDDEHLAYLVRASNAQIDQILQIDKDRIISHDSMVPGLCRAPEMTVFEKAAAAAASYCPKGTMARMIQVKGDHPQGLALCTRIWLMQSMEKEFGKVAHCKKPPTTGDPETDVAFVQFQSQEDADKAVEALRQGLTLSTTWQGITLKITGDWKPGEGGRGGSKPGLSKRQRDVFACKAPASSSGSQRPWMTLAAFSATTVPLEVAAVAGTTGEVTDGKTEGTSVAKTGGATAEMTEGTTEATARIDDTTVIAGMTEIAETIAIVEMTVIEETIGTAGTIATDEMTVTTGMIVIAEMIVAMAGRMTGGMTKDTMIVIGAIEGIREDELVAVPETIDVMIDTAIAERIVTIAVPTARKTAEMAGDMIVTTNVRIGLRAETRRLGEEGLVAKREVS
ncbi:unnamed protein product, partial [Symbiodinium sp. KB8]